MTAITVIAILAAAATIYGFVAMDSCERVKVATKGKKKKYQVDRKSTRLNSSHRT